MSDGITHARATSAMLLPLTTISLYCTLVVDPLYSGIAVGALIGHLVTPDLDHHVRTFDESRMFRLGCLIGWLWLLYWKPYDLLRGHRGVSHRLLIGSVERLIYLLWLPSIAAWYYWGLPTQEELLYILEFLGFVLLGQSIQDAVHLHFDGILFGKGR